MTLTVQEAKNLFYAILHDRRLILDYYGFNKDEMDDLQKFSQALCIAKSYIKLVKKNDSN